MKLALAISFSSCSCTPDHLKSIAFSSFSGPPICSLNSISTTPSLLEFPPSHCYYIYQNHNWNQSPIFECSIRPCVFDCIAATKNTIPMGLQPLKLIYEHS